MKNFSLICVFAFICNSVSADVCFDGKFIRGDTNGSGSVDIADSQNIYTYLFIGGFTPCDFESMDANDDGAINIADPAAINTYLFIGGFIPPMPFPGLGLDLTADSLMNSRSPGPNADNSAILENGEDRQATLHGHIHTADDDPPLSPQAGSYAFNGTWDHASTSTVNGDCTKRQFKVWNDGVCNHASAFGMLALQWDFSHSEGEHFTLDNIFNSIYFKLSLESLKLSHGSICPPISACSGTNNLIFEIDPQVTIALKNEANNEIFSTVFQPTSSFEKTLSYSRQLDQTGSCVLVGDNYVNNEKRTMVEFCVKGGNESLEQMFDTMDWGVADPITVESILVEGISYEFDPVGGDISDIEEIETVFSSTLEYRRSTDIGSLCLEGFTNEK